MIRPLLFSIIGVGLAVVLGLACAPADEGYDPYDGEDDAYATGYEAGQASGYDDGYYDGYEAGFTEAQDALLSCAEYRSTDLYYGEDEYQAVPLDELEVCRQ